MVTKSTAQTPPGGNRKLFSSVEFSAWVSPSELQPAEANLLRTYLHPHLRTIEAGTGGGRIILALGELGFTELHGFDFLPEMVRAARRRDRQRLVKLSVQDATQLAYSDSSFDQTVYLQQLISLIESPEGRRRALADAYRILRPGGTAVFSFLSHEARSQIMIYRMFRSYLRLIRIILRSKRDTQTWPWLRLGGRFNYRALWDAGPYVHWFRAEEAVRELSAAGFHVRAIGSAYQLESGRVCSSPDELLIEPLQGALFCVCTKA